VSRLVSTLALGALGLTVGCSAQGNTVSTRAAAPRRSIEAAAATTIGPARWLYTDQVGVIFDPSVPAPGLPGSEPALVDGARVMMTHGIVDARAPSAERLIGFRSLPARLGGGYALWSDARTYRADTFLGDLTVLAELGASGGIRPWIGTLLLRTSVGNVLVDVHTRALRRAGIPALADAVALDDLHAVRLDELGRASFTADGGATWTDVLASRGLLVTGLEEREDRVILASTRRPGTSLVFDRRGVLAEIPDPPDAPANPLVARAHPLTDLPTTSRALPDDTLARALLAGVDLPGDRLLVPQEHGLQVLARATLLPLGDATLVDVDDRLSRCQPITAGASAGLLACAGEQGAEVLSLDGAPGRSRLLATFPEQGLFVTGPRDRLGFVGRCGPLPPGSDDLGPATPRPEDLNEAIQSGIVVKASGPTGRVEPSRADEALYCARIRDDHWVSRRLSGEDARALYRFVPGDDGQVTALLLGVDVDKAPPAPTAEGPLPRRPATVVGEGVRVIRLDPADPALEGAAYPAVLSSPAEAGYRVVDPDFWQDDEGVIRGWVRLPAPGEPTAPRAPIFQGPAQRRLPVAAGRGGRSAGIQIDRGGHVKVWPLPEGVTEVVRGGRFGLAQAVIEGNQRLWETVDGGRTWARVEGPPSGGLAPPMDDATPHGCSAIGCTWGAGMVRLGWGSPPPGPDVREPPASGPVASAPVRGPGALKLTCSVDAAAAGFLAAPTKPRIKASPVKASPVKASPIKASPIKAPPGAARPAKGPKVASPIAKTSVEQASASIPISLRLGGSASIGALGPGGKWTGEVWSPFDPAAPARRAAAADSSLNTVQGAVIPILSASPREPVELLLSVGKRRLRIGAGTPAFLPFDVPGKISVAADGPDGELVALDADKGIVWIARGAAVSPAFRWTRVPDVARVRFTLGRRAPGGQLVVVGYSIVTGEVFAGDLDLGRAEVGPLVALGGIDTLLPRGAPGCAEPKGAILFLADVLTSVEVTGKGSVPLQTQEGLASLLIEASPEGLCAAGLEVGFPRGKPADLTVRFGPGGRGGAAVRTSEQMFKGTCALGAASR
jgi:hypothetical protein